MERWLIISNCHTEGLARAFQMINSGFRVTPVDWWTFHSDIDGWTAKFQDYFRILVLPDVENIPDIDWSSAPNLVRVPPISFSAYHPDSAYVFGSTGNLKGPLDVYHSMLILAAYQRGLSQSDAKGLFNGQFYQKVGYLDYWVPQRDRLIESFAHHGLDISQEVRKWGRQDAWMHTIDHPKVTPVYDVARIVMSSMGVPDQGSRVIPADNLTTGVSWAVYPEIGEHLGVKGSMRFKRFGEYTQIGLSELISGLYDLYSKEETLPTPLGEARQTLDRILESI